VFACAYGRLLLSFGPLRSSDYYYFFDEDFFEPDFFAVDFLAVDFDPPFDEPDDFFADDFFDDFLVAIGCCCSFLFCCYSHKMLYKLFSCGLE
jgi:hypothetical protein